MINQKKIDKFIEAMHKEQRAEIRTPKGFIYTAGGILAKIEDGTQYIRVNGKWVEGFKNPGALDKLNKYEENKRNLKEK